MTWERNSINIHKAFFPVLDGQLEDTAWEQAAGHIGSLPHWKTFTKDILYPLLIVVLEIRAKALH